MVQTLLAQPLGLAGGVVRRECQALLVPAQHVGIQFQRESSLSVVFRLQLQIVQLVYVSKSYSICV